MTGRKCEDIRALLVGYADGELSASESAAVTEHIAGCADCRAVLSSLNRSLELAQVVWEDGLAKEKKIGRTGGASWRTWARYAAAAAAVVILGAGYLTWRSSLAARQERQAAEQAIEELSFKKIEQRIKEEGRAARMLAAVELLGDSPDLAAVAEGQCRYIAAAYPNTKAAETARTRIQKTRLKENCK